MDEITREIIDRITTNFAVARPVPGGHTEKLFYDCSQLTQAELARLAAQALSGQSVPPFDLVVGMAYRGIAYAAAIAGGRPLGIVESENSGYTGFSPKSKRVLLVDDVVFQGRRISSGTSKVRELGGKVVAVACIIDRTSGGQAIPFPLFSAMAV